MRYTKLIVIFLFCSLMAQSQTKDSIYFAGIAQRTDIIMQHLEATFPDKPDLTDTLEYYAGMFARHIATIQRRTYRESARRPQYDYAIQLRNKNYKRVMKMDEWQRFTESLERQTPNGFTFCPVCRFALEPEKSCNHCGYPGRHHSE